MFSLGAVAIELRGCLDALVHLHDGRRRDRIVSGLQDPPPARDLLLDVVYMPLQFQNAIERLLKKLVIADPHIAYLRTAESNASNASFAAMMICAAAWYACWKRNRLAASSSRLTPESPSRAIWAFS